MSSMSSPMFPRPAIKATQLNKIDGCQHSNLTDLKQSPTLAILIVIFVAIHIFNAGGFKQSMKGRCNS